MEAHCGLSIFPGMGCVQQSLLIAYSESARCVALSIHSRASPRVSWPRRRTRPLIMTVSDVRDPAIQSCPSE